MLAFLFRHFADRIAHGGVAENRKLTFIDPYGPVFTGMVDPDNTLQHLSGRDIARQDTVFR
jgi:hypothetical protein